MLSNAVILLVIVSCSSNQGPTDKVNFVAVTIFLFDSCIQKTAISELLEGRLSFLMMHHNYQTLVIALRFVTWCVVDEIKKIIVSTGAVHSFLNCYSL